MLKVILRRLFGPSEPVHKQRDENRNWWGEHFIAFNFHPSDKLLQESDYQNEVLAKICVLAERAKQAGQKWQREQSRDSELKYRKTMTTYREVVEVAQHYYSRFERLPLHWTKLPEFVRRWKATVTTQETKTETRVLLST